MKACVWIGMFGMVLGTGCSTSATIESLAIADMGWYLDPNEGQAILTSCLDEVVATRLRTGGPGAYPQEDYGFQLRSRVWPNEVLPNGAMIYRGIAHHSGVPIAGLMDLGVTVFCLPGKPPAYLTDRMPARSGSRQQYFVYRLSGKDRLLVIIQQAAVALGGSIELAWWDPQTGQIESFWQCSGEEDGKNFAHETQWGSAGPNLVVHGIHEIKRRAYEKQRRELETELGMPVVFSYTPGSW